MIGNSCTHAPVHPRAKASPFNVNVLARSVLSSQVEFSVTPGIRNVSFSFWSDVFSGLQMPEYILVSTSAEDSCLSCVPCPLRVPVTDPDNRAHLQCQVRRLRSTLAYYPR